ncbi:hypothetical protein [Roseibium sp.]|nr:hypothetical protein [Roseibium sp.]
MRPPRWVSAVSETPELSRAAIMGLSLAFGRLNLGYPARVPQTRDLRVNG